MFTLCFLKNHENPTTQGKIGFSKKYIKLAIYCKNDNLLFRLENNTEKATQNTLAGIGGICQLYWISIKTKYISLNHSPTHPYSRFFLISICVATRSSLAHLYTYDVQTVTIRNFSSLSGGGGTYRNGHIIIQLLHSSFGVGFLERRQRKKKEKATKRESRQYTSKQKKRALAK